MSCSFITGKLICVFLSWQICYFFYKNIVFGFSLFLYETHTSFSGQPAYNDWFLSLYNVLFSSCPVTIMGIFEQDVSAVSCVKVSSPSIHMESLMSILLKIFPFFLISCYIIEDHLLPCMFDPTSWLSYFFLNSLWFALNFTKSLGKTFMRPLVLVS